MNIQKVPTHERQVIYFLNDLEFDNLQYYDEGKDFLFSKEIQVIPTSQIHIFLDHYEILGGNNPSNRSILVISPNNPLKYAEVSESTSQFALDKLTKIIRLCQLLGAKSVTIEDIYVEKDTSSIKTNTGASYTTIDANLATEKKKETELNKYIGYTSEFNGGKGNYEMAKSFLKKSHLGGDSFLYNLVEMRDPDFLTNDITSIKQKIKLSTKSTNTFQLLANLKIPVGGGKFELNTQNISQKDYILDISIEF